MQANPGLLYDSSPDGSMEDAYTTHGARVFNLSWGSNSATYDTFSSASDLFLSENDDPVVIVSAGNEAQDADKFQVFRLYLDESRIEEFPGLKRMSVTNPAVADVVIVGPEEVRLEGPLDLPAALDEPALTRHFAQLAAANRAAGEHARTAFGGTAT